MIIWNFFKSQIQSLDNQDHIFSSEGLNSIKEEAEEVLGNCTFEILLDKVIS